MADKKVVNKQIFRILLPMILENVLTVSASIVTAAMVGRLTTMDISAQGIANRMVNIYYSLFKGLSVGVTVLSAVYFGQGRRDKTKSVLRQSFVTSIPAGILVAVGFVLFAEPLARIFTEDPALIALSASYLKLLSASLPFLLISFYVTAAFQAQGNTRVPMYIAGIVNIVNIILGWAFIFGNFGAPALGLTGAAIALCVSYTVGAFIGLFLLYQPSFGLFANVKNEENLFALNKADMREVYTVGAPAAIENLLWQFATIIISRVIISYSASHYAAYQLGLQAEGVCEMLSIGFVTAATTLSANAIGRKDDSLYRTYFTQLCKICLGVSVLCTGILLFGSTPLMKILTDKQDLIEIGARYMFVMGFTQIPMNINKIYNGFIRSSGHRMAPAVISLVGIWGIRVVCSCLAGWVLHLPIDAIWWAIALDLFARYFISLAYFKKKKVIDAVENLPPDEDLAPAV